MSEVVWEAAELAARLRGEFDSSFAREPEADRADRVRLLTIRIGADAHAIRLSEIASLSVDRRITRIPGPLPDMLGLVGVRGSLLPVFDLRLLLGYPAGPPPRWLVIAVGNRLGLAFDQLDGHTVVAAAAILPAPAGTAVRPAAHLLLEGSAGAQVALLHLPTLVDEIAGRARRARPIKER